MWFKWLPWRFLVRRVARAHGFLDPIRIQSALSRFAQPSEVAEPIELLRAGVVMHARGLINSKVLQNNMDWVWPYWVQRQFDPLDKSFVPRAFSITHINLTQRNWTAVGLPDLDKLPIVDPRGMVTPFLDGWSLDFWLLNDDGRVLLPPKIKDGFMQKVDLSGSDRFAVLNEATGEDMLLKSRVEVDIIDGVPKCRISLEAKSDSDAWLVISLRPCNSEGVSFIHRAALAPDRKSWLIEGEEGEQSVEFSEAPRRHHISAYRNGDVYLHLKDLDDELEGQCDVGMTTGASLFRVKASESKTVSVDIPLLSEKEQKDVTYKNQWSDVLDGVCKLQVGDQKIQDLYDSAIRTLILHSPCDVYPGPYTYKRFWFRDAAFIINSLLCLGLKDRAERAIDQFPHRQNRNGYFHSQDGEWDSNGEALWIINKFCEFFNAKPKQSWANTVKPGAKWIINKRLSDVDADSLHAGLLPAGFSAEHLGPNDYYYWDDFWGVAGLQAASSLAARMDWKSEKKLYEDEAELFMQAINNSLKKVESRIGNPAMPASPYRRLDAGAIGSIAVGYPTCLFKADDRRLLETCSFLMKKCFLNNGFFQDMIHSGINAYLTLHIAQVLLRAGDERFSDLIKSVADLASPTGQWPEAVHPQTLGGCMGDGQHVWAAAEWVIMIRNCFVREEGDSLILFSGFNMDWFNDKCPLVTFGPAPTSFGEITLSAERYEGSGRVRLQWGGLWHNDEAPDIKISLPKSDTIIVKKGDNQLEIER